MEKGVIVHYDVDYEYELLNDLTERGASGIYVPVERVCDYILEFITKKYGIDNFNAEAISIRVEEILRDDKPFPIDELRYGNLYSFVLLHGINVPYYLWVYDDHYVGPNFIYHFHEGSGRCRMEPITQEVHEQIMNRDDGQPIYFDPKKHSVKSEAELATEVSMRKLLEHKKKMEMKARTNIEPKRDDSDEVFAKRMSARAEAEAKRAAVREFKKKHGEYKGMRF